MSEQSDPARTSGAAGRASSATCPDSRPGPRSPRRDDGRRSSGGRRKAARRSRAAPAADAAARRAAKRERRREARPARSRGRARAARPEAEPESGGGLEDIAWAGVAAAAEAATLGVRLRNTRLEALRGNSERS